MPTNTESRSKNLDQIIVITSIGIATSFFTAHVTRNWASFTADIAVLVDPNPPSIKSRAVELYEMGGDFALNAWQYVGGDIDYVYYGSQLEFYDHSVACYKCMLPLEVENAGKSNCVGKSVLLASLLRNYYSADDVYVVIGEFRYNGVGGHAWVILRRDNEWYVLESTVEPPPDPWKTMGDLSEIYIPDAWFNDRGMICYDPEVCNMSFVLNGDPRYALSAIWSDEVRNACNC